MANIERLRKCHNVFVLPKDILHKDRIIKETMDNLKAVHYRIVENVIEISGSIRFIIDYTTEEYVLHIGSFCVNVNVDKVFSNGITMSYGGKSLLYLSSQLQIDGFEFDKLNSMWVSKKEQKQIKENEQINVYIVKINGSTYHVSVFK